MLKKLMEKHGSVEVFLRKLATFFSPLKKAIKRRQNKKKKESKVLSNEDSVSTFKNVLQQCNIAPGDIVIVHSSIDGLKSLSLNAQQIVDLILDTFKGATILFATFPIIPKAKKDIYKYDPKKTMCWTGILPNVFLQKRGVVRSMLPYNSLAAYGDSAETIMNNNILSNTPHGEHSSWHYCCEHHAKILFIGTTSRESNTMAIHMAPDILGDDWPIKGWYEKRDYLIIDGGKEIHKSIYIQKGFWYKYVNEYKTDYLLKTNGLLKSISTANIVVECVPDCFLMMDYLLKRCKNGNLMYSIPKKYYKGIKS